MSRQAECPACGNFLVIDVQVTYKGCPLFEANNPKWATDKAKSKVETPTPMVKCVCGNRFKPKWVDGLLNLERTTRSR